MNYQACRWYDPYPRLAFALKLLYLAPQPLQDKANATLKELLREQFGVAGSQVILPDEGQRWYDHSESAIHGMELLKSSPEAFKTNVADVLLRVLTE